ncbi:hypothetical protein GCM10010466_49510 [Planomonospora alba]|uniref:DUF4158 domain-containing protein n=1 Tax=Planomonospora alba TaxID=161354 RepID=A0ABP6NMV1_9ACTN
MVAPVFTEEELEGLRRFPEIGREELFRFFTLTPADVAFIDPGRGRGLADRLGLAVALCTLPWLGFVPDDVASAPRAAVARLAEQLGVDPDVIPFLRASREDPYGPSAAGREVPEMAAGGLAGAEGAG